MANTTVEIVISSPPATGVTYTPAAPSFTAPVSAGTVMGTIAIAPTGWAGTLALTGADAASFTLTADMKLEAAAALSAKTYNLTLTATP
jgi:hypothetical protein